MSIGNRPLSPGTSKDKRNSSNKFELRDGVVFKTVVIPPVAPECSAPLILKPNTGQKPGPALSTGHRHVYNFTVNISNLLSVVANTHDSPMLKKNPYYPKFSVTPSKAANIKACRWIRSYFSSNTTSSISIKFCTKDLHRDVRIVWPRSVCSVTCCTV